MRYVYFASNEQEQEQRQGVKEYLAQRQVYMGDCTVLLSEYLYNDPEYDNGIKYLFSNLRKGDILYVWDLAAIGKNLNCVYANLLFASTKGLIIVLCNDGVIIGQDVQETNAFLRGIGIAIHFFYNSVQGNTKRALAEKRRLLEKEGGFYNKRGEWVTKLGAPKGVDMSKARKAAYAIARKRKEEWKAKSVGYNWAIQQLQKGVPRKVIIEEFNRLHQVDPDAYSTREGKELSKGQLSIWAKELSEKIDD